MGFSERVARELATAGLVKQNDIDEAAKLLSGPLEKMKTADQVQKDALEDQDKLYVEREKAAKTLAVGDKVGDLADAAAQESKLASDYDLMLDDEVTIETAEQAISDAYDEAAQVLVDAQLLDPSRANAVAPVISRTWAKRRR